MEKNRGRKNRLISVGMILFIFLGMISLILFNVKKERPKIANNEKNETFKVVSKLPTTKKFDASTVTIQQGNLTAYVNTSRTISSAIKPYREYYGIGERVTLVAQFDKVIKSCPDSKITFKFGDGSPKSIPGTISGSTIVFTYDIASPDSGALQVIGLSGTVTDNDNNVIRMGLPTEGVQYTTSRSIIADSTKNYFIDRAHKIYDDKSIACEIDWAETPYILDDNQIINYSQSELLERIKVIFNDGGKDYQGKGTIQITNIGLPDTNNGARIVYTPAEGDHGIFKLRISGVCDIAGNCHGSYTMIYDMLEEYGKRTPYVLDNYDGVEIEANGNVDNPVEGTARYNYCNAGKVISVKVHYNEAIYANASQGAIAITGNSGPYINLTIGSSTKTVYASKKLDNNSLQFDYTVTAGDNGNVSVSIPAGIVYDRVGHPSVADSRTSDYNNIVVDTVAPKYDIKINGERREINGIGKTINITMIADEYVNKATNKIKFGTRGAERSITETTDPDAIWAKDRTYTYTIQSGDNDVFIFLSKLQDLAGNNAVNKNSTTDTIYVNYYCYADTTGPTATITSESKGYTSNSMVTYNISLSDNSESFAKIKSYVENCGVKANTFELDDIVVTNGTIVSSTTDEKGNINTITVATNGDGKQTVYIKPNSFSDCSDPENTNSSNFFYDEVIIDTTAPSITNISQDPVGWTNTGVTLRCYASDNEPEEDLGYWINYFDNGWKDFTGLNGSIYEYTVDKNGYYKFIVYDSASNKTERVIHITNIDKTAPVINSFIESSENPGQLVYDVQVESADQSGIASMEINGVKVSNSGEYTVRENGTYILTVIDNAGNRTTSSVEVTDIDDEPPVLEVNYSKTELTKDSIEVKIKANEKIFANGWSTSYGSNGLVIEKTYESNTKETVIVSDEAGNKTSVEIEINNIDSFRPVITDIAINPSGWTNESVTVICNAYDNEGEENLSYLCWDYKDPSNVQMKEGKSIIVDSNRKIIFAAKDKAGNSSENEEIIIENIDKVAPEVVLEKNGEYLYIDAEDDASGIDYVEVNGTKLLLDDQDKAIIKMNTTGTYYVTVVDRAGNKTTESVEYQKIDTAPEAPLVRGYDGSWKNDSITVELSANSENGLDKYQYSKDQMNWTDIEGNTFTTTEEGENKIYFRAVDVKGYPGTDTSAIFKIDNTKPSLTATYRSGRISIAAIDGASGIDYCEVNGSKIELTNGEGTYNVTVNGKYYVLVKDKAGNEETSTVEVIDLEDVDVKIDYSVEPSMKIKEENGFKYLIFNSLTAVEKINQIATSSTNTVKIVRGESQTEVTGNVATGDKIVLENLGNHVAYIIVIKGDINKDGDVTLNDIFNLNNYRIGGIDLSTEQWLAGDVNEDKTINMRDIYTINNYRIGGIENF